MVSKSKPKAAQIHRCVHCHKEFAKKYRLTVHLKTHLPKTEFKCPFCKYMTNFQPKLNRHVQSHTRERPYKCQHPNCSFAFGHKGSLDRHQLVHKKEDESLFTFKCSECPYKTLRKESLKKHLVVHSNVKPYSCDLCPSRFKYKYDLKPHRNRVHFKLKPFKCHEPSCNYTCLKKASLAHHQLGHMDYEDRESFAKFKCPNCPYRGNIKKAFEGHLSIHSDVREFSCPLCPHRTKKKSSLTTHFKLVHSRSTQKVLKCPQENCRYSTLWRSNLTGHLKVHVDEWPFVCSVPNCGFRTKRKRTLINHGLVHREEKPFKCSFCAFDCKDKGNLVVHIRGHTGETPYPCPSCPFSAKSSMCLNAHLNRCGFWKNRVNQETEQGDSGVQNAFWKCQVVGCGFSTNKNSSLAIHYNEIHYLPRLTLFKIKL